MKSSGGHMEADLKNPNLGRPDFEFSYSYPKEFDRLLKPPKRKT